MASLYILTDAYNLCNRFVESGSCSSTVVYARITEACRRLMVKADWAHTTQTVRIRTNNQMFPLPREAESIRAANVENEAVAVFGQTYEFLTSGPGEIMHKVSSSGLKDLVDAGNFPTMYDPPSIEDFDDSESDATNRTLGEGYPLIAFSTDQEDVGRTLTIYGRNKYLNDHSGSGATFTPGESLKINMWAGGVEGSITGAWADFAQTTKLYREITKWVKPITKGYITLYSLDATNNYMWILAKAHPDDTVPVWRRYKLSGQPLDQSESANVLALCKMKALPLTRADDVLPIQNLDAIKLMVIAIREENAGNFENALAYEQDAVRLLNEQLGDVAKAAGALTIIDYDNELAPVQVNDTGLIL